MNGTRISGVIQKGWYNAQRDIFRLFDMFFWPAFTLFTWGLFSVFIQKSGNTGINIVSLLLGAIILWTFFDRASKDISLAMVDELWNRNFINLFSTPLTIGEYIAGITVIAVVKLTISITFMFFLAQVLYGFRISEIGFYLIPASIGLTVFGWSLSLIVQAFILRYGHTVEVFIWAIATLVQPLSCVFYPLSTLPQWAQSIALCLPTTYIFENMRRQMAGGGIDWTSMAVSFGLTLVYLLVAFFFFSRSFAHAKKSGALIKNY